ncbi:hypothetical protein [Rhizobium leguminosarum]|uniref:hypothetical protein n=1 Tax=Rhizobium leguminosarum TaxID=384 RepID=UPI0013AF01D1|nr:hypothetical protein [Rhizobium leguminosarum]
MTHFLMAIFPVMAVFGDPDWITCDRYSLKSFTPGAVYVAAYASMGAYPSFEDE